MLSFLKSERDWSSADGAGVSRRRRQSDGVQPAHHGQRAEGAREVTNPNRIEALSHPRSLNFNRRVQKSFGVL